jgi:hypothetical protein
MNTKVSRALLSRISVVLNRLFHTPQESILETYRQMRYGTIAKAYRGARVYIRKQWNSGDRKRKFNSHGYLRL